MHAITLIVKMDPARFDQQKKELQERIVPIVRQQPGFVSGTWSYDRSSTKAMSHIVFEGEDAAKKFAVYVEAQAKQPNDAGVTFESIGVAEVLADARRAV